jgi:hypothetical protein
LFSDSLRQRFGKTTTNELTGCFQPNEFTYACKGKIPIYTYIPEMDCEATLLHPSTTKIPDSCEYRFFKLSKTLWIPQHLSNQWHFVNPQTETFIILCPQETTTVKIQKEGKLRPGCKGYSSYVTLNVMSTTVTNLTNDYVPSAPIDYDCCFEDLNNVKLEDLPLHIPLVNIMSSADDLRVASMKTEEVQQMIKDQEIRHNQHFYMVATSWGSALAVICIIAICICCSCCKCCRTRFFWFWNKWSPRECWRHDKCCVGIYNNNGPRVAYTKANTSPAISMKSLPVLGSIVTDQPKGVQEETSKAEV